LSIFTKSTEVIEPRNSDDDPKSGFACSRFDPTKSQPQKFILGGRGVETPVWEGTEVVLWEPSIGGDVLDVLVVVGEAMAMGRGLVLRRIMLADLPKTIKCSLAMNKW